MSMDWIVAAVRTGGLLTLAYFLICHTVYLLFAAIAAFRLRRHRLRSTREDFATLRASVATPGISILSPAWNEERTVVDSVRSLLALDFPEFEVIVVNDGSTDGTLPQLAAAFELVRAAAAVSPVLPTKAILGVYRSMTEPALTVVDKQNGGKADAINAALNVARFPLVCVVDADSVLEDSALLKIVQPFIEDPTTVAAGGIVRVANDCVIEDGRIVSARLPRALLPLFQSVEYLRAFLSARVALSRARGLLIISGAFGLFRRDVVVEAGGFSTDTVGEDLEIVTRLHRHCRDTGRPYRVAFRPDPVCWTQVPMSLRMLARQRNRWQRGSLEVLQRHAGMIGNPRYGVIGLFALPYFLIFEALAPLIETLGYLVSAVALVFGILNWEFARLLFLVAIVYGSFVSVAAVMLQEASQLRLLTTRELFTLLTAALIENLGYRQLTAWWRLQGTIDFLRGVKAWGAIRRRRFSPNIS
jgi:cellulose synthase/poly-beta-1,6-N-acetylglucosamine synthase-like glycosyltransferase